ncbi:hypothetical protein CspeluHIS016_0301140 [Cutaneotrichosporon spelunceum]|uniref:Uncharacterized protein n=1 Tax=Cutaneotrichosporon spelunceum TaxID=1672016 RepID=A0AAD3YBY2_9TREE|nr:hypothetical protein CspeluHIS016_0301140 [Cutaneotrichosporon spelunceum]
MPDQLPRDIVDRIASFADASTCDALLRTSWAGYLAAVPYVYADVTLTAGLLVGLLGDESQAMPGSGWPNTASHERKCAALRRVRRLVVDATSVYRVPTVLRPRTVVFEPGADVSSFIYLGIQAPSVCIRLSGLEYDWDGLESLSSFGSELVTVHGFDLRNPAPKLALGRRTRFWPRQSAGTGWTGLPWLDNLEDWGGFLESVLDEGMGRTFSSRSSVELIVPHEPLTCAHVDEYSASLFFMRVILRMDLGEGIAMPFGVGCACGERRVERWCSAPLIDALRAESGDGNYDELIRQMQRQDARLPPPPTGLCNAHVWDVTEMAPEMEREHPGLYAEACAQVVQTLVAEARALLLEESGDGG